MHLPGKNRLTLIKRLPAYRSLVGKKALIGGRGLFECSCGKQRICSVSQVKKSHIKSCGCLVKEVYPEILRTRLTIHGYSKNSQEYRAWQSMKQRCFNKKTAGFKHYGGRGITVCKRWIDSFENFIQDMGDKPTRELSIDRINNDGNYEPGNCRWADQLTQVNNRRNTIKRLEAETANYKAIGSGSLEGPPPPKESRYLE